MTTQYFPKAEASLTKRTGEWNIEFPYELESGRREWVVLTELEIQELAERIDNARHALNDEDSEGNALDEDEEVGV
jgi:hypothetical protein